MTNAAFISYRRQHGRWVARGVFQELRRYDVDVFMDVESINGGRFDEIIATQIAARPYFLLILTPDTLQRCAEPGDWLSREIGHAIETERAIVPIVTPEFDRSDISTFLSEEAAGLLARLDTLNLNHEYWQASMEKLRTRYMKPAALPTVEVPPEAAAAAQRAVQRAAAAPDVSDDDMLAQMHAERAWARQDDDPEAALAEFTEAIRLNPQFADAYGSRAALWLQKGEADKAMADLNEALRLEPSESMLYFGRAGAHTGIGDVDGAIDDLNEAIRLEPDTPSYYAMRAALHLHRDDFEAALDDANATVGLDEQYETSVLPVRGVALFELGEHEAALADFERIVELYPDSDLAASVRPRIESLKGRSATDDARARAGALLREALEREYDAERMAADLEEVIRLDPNVAEAYYWRAQLQLGKREFDRVLADMNRAIELGLAGDKLATALVYRGVAQRAAGRVNAAVADYSKAIELDPKRPEAYLYRAYAYRDLGDTDRATLDLKLVMRLFPDSEEAAQAQEAARDLLKDAAGEALGKLGGWLVDRLTGGDKRE